MSTQTAPMDLHSFTYWLATGEQGSSSREIVTTLTGVPVGSNYFAGSNWPRDPSDFRRCELLLRAVPAARSHLHHMTHVAPTWAALVEAWDELVELGESEVPGMFSGSRPRWRAPKMYARMKQLQDTHP